MASNVQAGTRGLSASDWVRIKRLRGSRNFQSDKDGDITNSTIRLEPTTGRRIYTEFGTSKIRRPASFWTDYRASQTVDYVLESQNSETKSRRLDIHRICGCPPRIPIFVFGYNDGYVFVDSVESQIPVGTQVIFNGSTNLAVQNGVSYYVIAAVYEIDRLKLTLSLSQGGSQVSFGSESEGNTNSPMSIPGPNESAITHNGVCAKCIHS